MDNLKKQAWAITLYSIISCIYIFPHLIISSCLRCYFCWSNNFWDGKQHLFRLASLAKQSNVVFVRRNSNNIKELIQCRTLLEESNNSKTSYFGHSRILWIWLTILITLIWICFARLQKNISAHYIFANILRLHNQSFQTNSKQRENCKWLILLILGY